MFSSVTFSMYGLEFRAQGLGFKVLDLGCGVQKVRVSGLGLEVYVGLFGLWVRG
jgi:hypothetical protein